MLKHILVSTFVCLVVTAALSISPARQISDTQLDEVLADRVAMRQHLRCVLGENPCDSVGRKFKTFAPLVLRGVCPNCSEQDVKQIRYTLAYVQRNYPWEWSKMIRQYG